MFAEMKTLVAQAQQGHYALLAINCVNMETARAAIRVAEQHRAPIILNLYQAHLAHFPADIAFPLVKSLAEKAQVPVTLSLDHGKDPGHIHRCFRAGFSGLMIDASAFTLDENVRQTGRWWNWLPVLVCALKGSWGTWETHRSITMPRIAT